MKSVFIIATNTFREVIRDRILYGIVIFALLLVGLSIALGGLSFTEQARISANFGFTGIQIGASILSIFIGSTLVSREIEKQTILTLLVRPITRTQFLIGKFAGLVLVILTVMVGLAAVVGALIAYLGLTIDFTFVIALYGILLESLVLVAITMFFGSVSRPIMTVIFASSLFLIGHWVSSLRGLMNLRSVSESTKAISKVVLSVVPDLERFNWRSGPVYSEMPLTTDIVYASIYALGWMLLILALTSFAFRRRDFV